MSEDIDVTSENFTQYFRDVRTNRPQKGEIMARFWAVAEFVNGPEKKELINLLKSENVYQAVQSLRKLQGVVAPDCYRVCREICEDLLFLPEQEVEEKSYRFMIEFFYYTQKQLVPKNKHWEVIKLLEYDNERKTYKSTIEL